ncbi:MAG TPA: glycosyltransferase [Gemmatales bacterium]|nr:glycosyltransferase [Gemmatales bacterium]
MRLLAQNNRILWVNSIGYRAPTVSTRDIKRAWNKLISMAYPLREVIPNLFVLNPFVIPAWSTDWARRFNRRLLQVQVKQAMRQLRFHKPINWIFNPAASVLAGELGEEQVIYYCVDEYTAFSGVPTQALIRMEQQLLERADVVLVSAEKLLHSKRPVARNIHLIRHGVDFDHFHRAVLPETSVAEELVNLPKPVLGYFGLLSQDWVDVLLLEKVAERYSSGSLVLIGKVAMDLGKLPARKNVHILGRKPYSSLPRYCKGFDVALIPFPISQVTLNANPLKAREYLAAGLPTVSTAIPEVEVLGECYIGKCHEDFLVQLDDALRKPGPDRSRSERMRSESWSSRLNDIRRCLATIT